MDEIIFLTLEEVLEIHADQILRYGGIPGVRDLGLLQSAVAMPAMGLGEHYLHSGPFEMSAAYLFHIVQNHPFLDANKRTGAAASAVFLSLNGIELDADEGDFEDTVRNVAEGNLGKAEITEFIRSNCHL